MYFLRKKRILRLVYLMTGKLLLPFRLLVVFLNDVSTCILYVKLKYELVYHRGTKAESHRVYIVLTLIFNSDQLTNF